jgi:hypothetical protein
VKSAASVVLAGLISGVVSSVTVARISENWRPGSLFATHPSGGAPSRSPDSSASTPEARLERHIQAIKAHWEETMDPAWSEPATVSLARELSGVAQKVHAEVRRVDCRSTTCIADVLFDSYDDETKTFMRFLAHPYQENCTKTLRGPVPADRSSPYLATIVFDCSGRLDAGSSSLASKR